MRSRFCTWALTLGAAAMLCAPNAHAQDTCATALTTLMPGGSVTVDLSANANNAVAGCNGSPGTDGADVWYQLPALTAGDFYTITTTSTGDVADTAIELFAGPDCGTLTSVACNEDINPDPFAGDFFSTVTFEANGTDTYWLFAEPSFSDPGTGFGIDMSAGVTPTANSICSLAGTTGADTTVLADNTTTGNFAAACGGGTNGDDFWVEFTGLTDTFTYTVSTSANGAVTDTVVQIWEGADCATATDIACNADIDGANFFSSVTFQAQAGMRYWAFTETEFGDGPGTWDLTIDAGTAAPGNDLCANATAIGSLPFSDSPDITAAGDEGTDGSSATGGGGGGGRDVWYSYTTGGSPERVRVDISNANTDAGGAVFDGGCGALTEVTSLDAFDSASGLDEAFFVDLAASTTYLFLVEGFTAANVGVVDFSVTTVTPSIAPGDSCATASALTPGVQFAADTTASANQDNNECFAGFPLVFGNDLWLSVSGLNDGSVYTLTTSDDGSATVSGTIVEAFSGACGSLTQLDCSGSFAGDFDAVSFAGNSTDTFFFLVEGELNDEGGTFNIDLTEMVLAAGDTCDMARTDLTLGGTVSVDTTAAADMASTTCGGGGGNDQWFQLPALMDSNLYVVTTLDDGSGADTVMEVFAGPDCMTLASVGCNDDIDGAANRRSEVSFVGNSTDTFYVLATTFGAGSSGTFDLTFTDGGAITPPSNDTCGTATVIDPATDLPFTDNTTSTLAATDTIMNANTQGTGGPDVFYSFTPDTTGQYNLTSANGDNGDFNSSIGVYTGACGSLTEVDSVDDFSFIDEELSLTLTAGTAYTIVVEGRAAGDVGTVNWSLSAPIVAPANDTCATATVISGPAPIAFSDTANNTLATDTSDNSASVTGGGLDVWYTYTPGVGDGGLYEVRSTNTGNGEFNSSVGVHTGGCGTLTEVASQDDFSGDDEAFVVDLAEGTQYWFLVEGRGAADVGLVTFSLTGVQAGTIGENDTCADALAITADGGPVNVDTTGNANLVGSSCNASAGNLRGTDLWLSASGLTIGADYRLTTADDGSATLANTLVTLYEGACGSLTELDCTVFSGGFESVMFTATATDHIFLVQGGFLDSAGTMDVELSTFVLGPGGTCSNPAPGPSVGGTVLADTTGQPNLEDSCSAFGGPNWGTELWLDLGVLAAGNYEVETSANGAVTDTIAEIFSDCAGTSVNCDDDGGTGLFSLVAFTADGSTNYFAMVQAFGEDEEGTFDVTLRGVVPPSFDLPGFGVLQGGDAAVLDAADAETGVVGSTATFFVGGDFAGMDTTTFWANDNDDFGGLGSLISQVSTADGSVTDGSTITGGVAPNDFPVSLAWDPNTSQFYAGLADSNDFEGGAFGTLDHTTGTFTEIANYSDPTSVQCIAFDSAGTCYMLTYDSTDAAGIMTLNTVDTGTGALTTVGSTGVGTVQFSEMDFHDGTGTLYWQVLNAATATNELYSIDTGTGAATFVGNVDIGATFFALGFANQNAGVDNWSDY